MWQYLDTLCKYRIRSADQYLILAYTSKLTNKQTVSSHGHGRYKEIWEGSYRKGVGHARKGGAIIIIIINIIIIIMLLLL